MYFYKIFSKFFTEEYTQEELYFAASNLNSRCLNSIDDRTPIDLFIEIFGGIIESMPMLFMVLQIVNFDNSNSSDKCFPTSE